MSKYSTVEIRNHVFYFCNLYACLSGMESNRNNLKMDLLSDNYIFGNRNVLQKRKEMAQAGK